MKQTNNAIATLDLRVDQLVMSTSSRGTRASRPKDSGKMPPPAAVDTSTGNDVDGPSVSTGVAKRTSDQTVDDIGAKTKRARSATQEDEFSRGDVSSGGTTTYKKMYRQSVENPDKFWALEAKKRLLWRRDFDAPKRYDLKNAAIQWFPGGQLNVAENCIDRHLIDRADDIALVYEADSTQDGFKVTYQGLHDEVCRLANTLKTYGVVKGDTVCIYMPMTPSVVYAMLACARIGAIHSVVFAGFSAEALRARIVAANSKVVITADEGIRGGKIIPLKLTVDAAVSSCDFVKTVFVQTRTGNHVPMGHRDVRLEKAMAKERPVCPVQVMDAEDPLFILYTSGSTGMPKGLVHTTGGLVVPFTHPHSSLLDVVCTLQYRVLRFNDAAYCTYASITHEHIFDYKRGDVYACVADAGWITGHTYVIYGPLLNGATTVIFESTPVYPDAGRYWEMVERLKINQFYTAPTAIRMLIKSGPDFVKKYDRSSLRILGTVGEPINPEAWKWYHDVVGDGKCKIVDTWWQTETGGVCMTPLPGDDDAKPGAAMRPFFGIEPVLVDAQGQVLKGNGVSGNLCLKQIPPGMSRTVYGDHERFKEVYYKDFPGLYFTGDGARRDEDGHYWITGRVDDVINVAGHRLGTAEVESALVEHSAVAEAAVVGYPHEIKGQGIYAYVTLKDGNVETPKLIEELGLIVRKMVGPFAKPDVIQIAPGLPKTRSGKIMRRVLRKVAADETEELGDTSTLADPSVVVELVSKAKSLCSK